MLENQTTTPKFSGVATAGGTAMLVFGVVLSIATPLVEKLEGRTLGAYLDPAGVATICNGETNHVQLGQTLTNKDCDALLKSSLSIAIHAVDREITVPLSPYQRAGLASFTYNLGEGTLAHSSVRRFLNQGQTLSGCNAMRDYVHIKVSLGGVNDMRDGKKDGYEDCRIAANNCPGLVRRREQERSYCLMVDNGKN